MNEEIKRTIIAYLTEFVTESRMNRMDSVLADRTRYVTVVLEDICNAHNASAVIRSCECFGAQDVHIIESENEYSVNPCVTQGSAEWIDIIRYNEPGAINSETCLERLKASGYRLVATTLDEHDCVLDDLPIDRPLAIMFGNEEKGLTDYAMKQADMRMIIPMFGFTQSFNLSVSAALTLHSIVPRLHDSEIDWHLSEGEILDLKYRWMKRIVRRSDLLERRFLESLENHG
ncbi:MAG: RNA methyltransferase [Candidatus Zixiibacteriota bacterium]